MNILIDIGHPAHVHVFKNFAWEMQNRGHKILFSCREKEFEVELLTSFGFSFHSFGKKHISILGKLYGMVKFDVTEFLVGLRFKPDILLSHGSIYAAHAAFLLRKPHVSIEDTFNFEQIHLYLPFSKVVLTGNFDHPSLGKKEILYAGYHELAYLRPDSFKADKSILSILGVPGDEKYVLLRFVAWQASHDYGHKGISNNNKLQTIKEFEKYARVFISAESELPTEFNKYKIKIPPHRMHDVLAYASLLIGESSTMAEECAMLGVPSIFLNDKSTYYTQHLEKDYGLLYNYGESDLDLHNAVEKGVELLKSDNIKEEWQSRRQKMLADKIDVTSFWVWFVENYPSSAQIMRENPDSQYRFK